MLCLAGQAYALPGLQFQKGTYYSSEAFYMFLIRNGNDFAAMLILAGLLGKLSGVRPGKPVRATPGNVAGGWGEELLKRPLVEAAGLNIW